jgi:hypothetical protein
LEHLSAPLVGQSNTFPRCHGRRRLPSVLASDVPGKRNAKELNDARRVALDTSDQSSCDGHVADWSRLSADRRVGEDKKRNADEKSGAFRKPSENVISLHFSSMKFQGVEKC